jgi:hypothetical protein
MTNDERMQREFNLITTIKRQLPEFAKACADDSELMLPHQDAFAATIKRARERIHDPSNGDQTSGPSWEGSACDREEPRLTTLDLARTAHFVRNPAFVVGFDFRPRLPKDEPS